MLRTELIKKSLEELSKLRDSNKLVIVEGERDKKTLNTQSKQYSDADKAIVLNC